MPYGKVDDQIAFDSRAIEAGNPAIGAWVRMLSHCCAHLTDGFVPTNIARMIGSAKERRSLISVGFLAEVEGGYQILNFFPHNGSAETVRARRATDAAKKAAGRASQAAARGAVSLGESVANPGRVDDESPRESPRESAESPMGSPGGPLLSTPLRSPPLNPEGDLGGCASAASHRRAVPSRSAADLVASDPIAREPEKKKEKPAASRAKSEPKIKPTAAANDDRPETPEEIHARQLAKCLADLQAWAAANPEAEEARMR